MINEIQTALVNITNRLHGELDAADAALCAAVRAGAVPESAWQPVFHLNTKIRKCGELYRELEKLGETGNG